MLKPAPELYFHQFRWSRNFLEKCIRSLQTSRLTPAAVQHEQNLENLNWQLVLRTQQINERTSIERPARKYLWVRRTSRRAYNLHMSKMHETISEFETVPTVVLFGSIVSIAILLSVLLK